MSNTSTLLSLISRENTSNLRVHTLCHHLAKDTVPETYTNTRPAVGANMAIFLGFTVCPEFTLNSLWRGLQAALCTLSITDLQLGSARFPVTVTTFFRGVGGKLCNQLVSCNWLVFLTTCEPQTAKTTWLHNPPGVIKLISWHWWGLRALRTYLLWLC
jgi:hypothetical protein